jgi:hypothetical protein
LRNQGLNSSESSCRRVREEFIRSVIQKEA